MMFWQHTEDDARRREEAYGEQTDQGLPIKGQIVEVAVIVKQDDEGEYAATRMQIDASA